MPPGEKQRRYEKTPRGQYHRHKANAKRRKVAFELTFEQWWAIWQESGLWEVRGNWAGGAVMMRNGDAGAYARGNVRIGMHTENTAERNREVAKRNRVAARRRHTARSTTVLFD